MQTAMLRLAPALPACLLWPALVSAQADRPVSPRVGVVNFGVRTSSVSGDAARFGRYRDLRDAPFIDTFRYARDVNRWRVETAFDHVGARDQRYAATIERPGTLRVSFDWDQIPVFYSADTRTPYVKEGAGTFRLADELQLAIQSGSATLRDAADLGTAVDTRSRRHVADVGVEYEPTTTTALRIGVSSTTRKGEQPWSAPFGFSLTTEVPRPIDERTDEVDAALEWADGERVLRVAYEGSFYRNDIETLVWESPARLTDTATSTGYITGIGTSQGRMALAPDSTAHSLSVMGTTGLPARSRAHAYVSVGNWSQDAALLPHTINSALDSPALSRPTADASARIVSANLGMTSRPVPALWLNARLRVYDFDNRTPPFLQPFYVRLDQAIFSSALGASEPFGYTRNYLDLDASLALVPNAALRIGYGREHDDRSYRFLETTTEHTVRVSVDSTGLSRVTLRGQFEHAVRGGDGFDEEVFSEIGEQISLRQFDISDRQRNRLSTILHVLPTDEIGASVSVGIGSDHRPDTNFGLRDNDHYFYTLGLDYAPSESASLGLYYGAERYDTFQRSRQANPGPQFDDPTRDWSTDVQENVHTVTGSVDLPGLAPRTSLRLSYDYNRSEAWYRYMLAPNTSLAHPEPLPAVTYALHRGQADLRYDLTGQLAIGASYWYDRFSVEDFAFEPQTLEARGFPGSGLFLGYMYRPYRAHTGWFRLIYGW